MARKQGQYQKLEEPKEAYLGDYSALAQQFLKKGRTPPIHSMGQGIAEVLGDVGEAYFTRKAAEKDQQREDRDLSAVAMAQQFASNPNLTRVGVNDALGQERTIANSVFDRPADPNERYAGAMAQIQDNPRAQIAAGPGVMDLAKQFEPPKDTYQVSDTFGVMRTPGAGGAPEVVMPPPKKVEPPKRYVVNGALVDEAGKPLYTAPDATKTKGIGEVYRDRFGGTIEQGMEPEVGPNGEPTGRQVPIAGGSKDPATIEQSRVKELQLSLPKASAALESAAGEFDKTITAIDEVLSPANATGLGDVTGFGGTSVGKFLTPAGGDAARVQARLDQIRGRTFIAGMNALKASSPNGATGLGAASEREGENVIQAQAALNQAQSDEDYAKALKEYRQALVDAKTRLSSTFQQEYGPLLPKASPEQAGFAGRGASGSWGDGETKVIAGARVTRMGN